MEEYPSLTVVQRTDVGRQREANEDSFGRSDTGTGASPGQGSLYIVADGMGGHVAGEVASRVAVETIVHAYARAGDWEDPEPALRGAVEQANAEICTRGQQELHLAGMGTTVVAAVVQNGELTIANVGDSRAYRQRGGRLEQLTRDHSWVAKAVEDGVLTPAEARDHPDRNVIYRSLGAERDVQVDVFCYALRAGDRVLLCSDGLTDVVDDELIAELAGISDPDSAATALIAAANEGGGPDNITVTLIVVGGSAAGGRDERPTPDRITVARVATPEAEPRPGATERATEPRGVAAVQNEEMADSTNEEPASAGSDGRRGGWLRTLMRGRR